MRLWEGRRMVTKKKNQKRAKQKPGEHVSRWMRRGTSGDIQGHTSKKASGDIQGQGMIHVIYRTARLQVMTRFWKIRNVQCQGGMFDQGYESRAVKRAVRMERGSREE